MENNSTNTSNQQQTSGNVINISYQNYVRCQQPKEKMELFKQKLRYQNYFEENEDINIIYPSTK